MTKMLVVVLLLAFSACPSLALPGLRSAIYCNCTRPGCGMDEDGPNIQVCKTYGGCMKVVSLKNEHQPEDEGGDLVVEYDCISEELWLPPEQPVVIPSLAVVFSLCLLYAAMRCRRGRQNGKPVSATNLDDEPRDPLIAAKDVHGIQQMLHDLDSGQPATTSGSGSGVPMLVPVTIARQVTLVKVIGRGRYGEVWQGLFKGENVAVKIFASTDEQSWLREMEVYKTTMLRHENLLGFIAADNKDGGMALQLWLITDYHKKGSLFDLLMSTTLDLRLMARLARSLANGLAFLHSEICGTSDKPAVAHRDLKTRNVLVRSDNSCVIADLGLAVRYFAKTQELDIPQNKKTGTLRYLAPEVLGDTLNPNHFDSYRRADIYSLGLILWEICRRTGDKPDPCELPYYDQVPADPTLDDMLRCVLLENQRPPLPSRWKDSAPLVTMTKLMRECWMPNPSARLTALRVRKTIDDLAPLIGDFMAP
uniref:receptor protein serine/threonine kinase n=1 Tax=Trichinella spiralis TaxID=6334 RepID=G9F9A0_TRISP|nr:Trk1 [Trichinella spiralis]